MESIPASLALVTMRPQLALVLDGSEIRICRAPFAARRWINNRSICGGEYSKVRCRDVMTRNGVPGVAAATRRTRSHGSSLSSRTIFLKKATSRISMA